MTIQAKCRPIALVCCDKRSHVEDFYIKNFLISLVNY